MLTKLSAWLGNPKRKYNDGLEIFNAIASDVQKKNFKEYFEKGRDQVTDQFDQKFTMLVNQVAFCQNRIKQDSQFFKQAIAATVANDNHIPDTEKKVAPETEANKKTDLDKLPEELAPVRERIAEIVPLMAKLHAEMSQENLPDDKRMPIIQQLVKLDDERRACWAKIDSYEPSEEEKVIEEKTIAMGADIQKRILQVKELISRAKSKAKEHSSKGKKELAAKAVKRGEEYRDELTQLELLIGK